MTDRSFTITRLLDAPPALVFRAWTDPDHLGWFFSGHGEPEAPQVDLRVGGAWRQTMIIGDDDRYVTGGVYREIAGSVMSKGAASSPTVASPSASRARIARRVGSASAENVALNASIIISHLR